MKFQKTIFIGFLLVFCKFFSQEYYLTNSFDTSNSQISGNFVFDVEKDTNGFIWLATQNGISRFDGKVFFNYTTQNGLPSNDVVQIVKDQYGTIWANCFRQPPSYFDEKKNVFITLKGKDLEKSSTSFTVFTKDINGKNIFFSGGRFFSVDKAKNISVKDEIEIIPKKLFYSSENFGHNIPKMETYIEILQNKYLSFNYDSSDKKNLFYKNKFIFIGSSTIEKFSDFKTAPFTYKKQKIIFNKPIKWSKISGDEIRVVTADNRFQMYDLETFRLKKDIKIGEKVTNGFFDEENGFFGGTMNDGLQFFSKSKIEKLKIPENLVKETFISIKNNEKGEVFAGNLSGEILKFEGKNFTKIKMDESSWIRKILFFGEKSLVITDNSYSINFQPWQKMVYKDQKIGLKKAKKINDSLALISTISGVFKLNVPKNKYQILNFPRERVGDISQINDHEFYVVSATGLYHYNLKTNAYQRILEKYNFEESAFDGKLLFVSTFKNEIYVFKNEKLIRIISDGKTYPTNAGRLKIIGNRLWIASTTGIYILSYTEKDNKFDYQIINISKNDGLTSDLVLEFSEFGNKVYAATEKGISVVPANIFSAKKSIPTQVVSVKINGKQREIQEFYHLEKDENNVSIVFSGSELSGHFQNFLFRINDGKWSSFSGNTLNLNLDGGENVVEVTAADNNGNSGKIFKILKFQVAIPFYERLWFWGILGGMFFGSIIFTYSRWKFLKQQEEFRAKLALENQRSKITADLHDDIGATLSSLQINSAIANKMIEKEKISDAQKILKKIENQSRKLSENIGDIVWSLKPNKDALMTLSTRIRNSASEILGSSDINYQIKIDKEINEEFQDFSERKNLVLIVKEALNNVIKYSKATEVLLIFKKFEHEYILEIKDNGIGFEPDFAKGNGLQNMKKRTEEIGGTFEIFSKDGTKVKICIPNIRD